jgi:crotonobetainyl-CoA:carnitine CoA-transferase CaiB-like acyl-CoA transferase
MPTTCVADLGGALEVVIAALQLLLVQTSSGRRSIVSLASTAAWFAEPLRQGITTSDGVLGGNFGGYRIYQTRNGWIAVAALEAHFQQALRQALGVPTLDPAVLQEAFLTRTADEWVAWARENDVPLARARD